MGGIHTTAASLGFYGDDLDPDEITAALRAQPTVGVRKGETWVTELGAEKVARTGSRRLKADRSCPGDLDRQTSLLAPLSNDLAVWTDLAGRFRGRLFCGLFLEGSNEGATLKPETILAMGSRGLRLELDIYGAEMPD